MKTLVLGFSGGLDTTFCAKYLKKEKNFEVHSVIVNTGGFSKSELIEIAKHAKRLGVKSHTIIDAEKEYYEKIIKYLVFGNVLKNNTYPLSVSAERLIQAIYIAEHVKKIKAVAVAHGSTGAGNDQIRFDMIFNVLIPDVEIITPIRDLNLSREKEIEYLKKENVKMNFKKSLYSINKGLWGTSVGGKETLSSKGLLPETAWPTKITKSKAEEVSLFFKNGELKKVNNKNFKNSVEAIKYLNSIAAPFGIGRGIHVGDTIIGIKGRVGFEAAAPILILKAHHHLEKHVLTKLQLQLKDSLSQFYGNNLHEGLILDPVMRNIEKFFTDSQKNVTGTVFIKLLKRNYEIIGIESKYDLMNKKFGKYGETNKAWSGDDAKGFTKIFGLQTKIYFENEKN